MVCLYDFRLNSAPLSLACKLKGLNRFSALCTYIKKLDYGRNSNPLDFSTVLREQRGSCSTKHAFLKQIAIENNKDRVKLYLGIYMMESKNTPGIGDFLEQYSLDYIPEAHCYLKIENAIQDFTRHLNSEISFESTLLFEEEIQPKQIDSHKREIHQAYLKDWIQRCDIVYSFADIWNIREKCISNLST